MAPDGEEETGEQLLRRRPKTPGASLLPWPLGCSFSLPQLSGRIGAVYQEVSRFPSVTYASVGSEVAARCGAKCLPLYTGEPVLQNPCFLLRRSWPSEYR